MPTSLNTAGRNPNGSQFSPSPYTPTVANITSTVADGASTAASATTLVNNILSELNNCINANDTNSLRRLSYLLQNNAATIAASVVALTP